VVGRDLLFKEAVMKTNSKKTALMVGAMAVMVSANAQASVIWSEDFSNDTVNTTVTQDFTGNAAPDWIITGSSVRIPTAVELGGTGTSFHVGRINDNSSSFGKGEVFMTQFAPFNTSNPGQSIFQISFDLRVDSYGGNVAAATPRVIVKPTTGTTNALVLGFGGQANVDNDVGTDLFLFATVNASLIPVPSATNAIGLIGGSGGTWAPGFDFGNYVSSVAADAANDTNDEFYRFVIDWNTLGTTNAITGTVTQLSSGQTTTFTRSPTAAVAFSSSDTTNSFAFESSNSGRHTQYIDNISVVIPEPTTGLIVGMVCVGGLLRRRRA